MNHPFVERRKVPHEHIDTFQAAIRQHFDMRLAEIKEHFDGRLDAQEKMLRSAFPDGDLDGHRRAHETVIASAADMATLWKSVREKTISGSIWAGIVLLAAALWEYVKDQVKR